MTSCFGGINAYTSVEGSKMLLALAKYVPSALEYTPDHYATTPPKLPLCVEDGPIKVVHSCTEVAQGCNFGPLCYSTGGIELLREFSTKPTRRARDNVRIY